MKEKSSFIQIVHQSARKKILFLPHAVKQMSRQDRMITTSDIQQVIEEGEIIEDYPEDIRGHSCLILGFREQGQPLHIVCSPKDDYLAIITTYIPDKKLWTNNFKERRS